jgi:tripeptide aminopeptidase
MVEEAVLERFLSYVKVDTQSDENSDTVPSTEKQLVLANMLTAELKKLGLEDISQDKNGYVMATLPSNLNHPVPTVGFIAHMDTSPDMSGTDVRPKITKSFSGEDIVLNPRDNIILSSNDFPELLNYRGQDIITTDGTTLLGADDKAGIAEIMTAMEYLVKDPSIKHGPIRIGFTPDEEIGRGADHFDVKKFGAKFAYTLDGGEIGELEYENFNAALATIDITGRNVHPGTAKDKMINSMHLGMELNQMLPVNERPEYTTGREGFFHLIDFTGTVEETKIRYLIRDHSRIRFDEKKKLISDSVKLLRLKYKAAKINLEVKDQYFNMREKLEEVMHIVDLAKEAMKAEGIEPIVRPIRGGTDGSRLSFMGLPCPNLFTGGHNYHGKFEFIPVTSMVKAVKVIIRIIKMVAEKDTDI